MTHYDTKIKRKILKLQLERKWEKRWKFLKKWEKSDNAWKMIKSDNSWKTHQKLRILAWGPIQVRLANAIAHYDEMQDSYLSKLSKSIKSVGLMYCTLIMSKIAVMISYFAVFVLYQKYCSPMLFSGIIGHNKILCVVDYIFTIFLEKS